MPAITHVYISPIRASPTGMEADIEAEAEAGVEAEAGGEITTSDVAVAAAVEIESGSVRRERR